MLTAVTPESKAKKRKLDLSAKDTSAARSFWEMKSDAGATAGMPPFLVSGMQRKLALGTVNDPQELEADRVADHLMRTPDSGVSSSPFSSPVFSSDQQPQTSFSVQRKCSSGGAASECHCDECEKENAGKLQRAPATSESDGNSGTSTVSAALRSPSQSLDTATRAFFEPRLGVDLSDVRVHTDQISSQSAQDVNALAYTMGNDIVFRQGEYSPKSDKGRRLLAHELTHVGQQRQGATRERIQCHPDEKPVDVTQTVEKCSGKKDITKEVNDFVHDLPGILNGILDLTAEQKKGVQFIADTVFGSEAGVDLSKYKFVSCTQIRLPELGNESFSAYVDSAVPEVGLQTAKADKLSEIRQHTEPKEDKEKIVDVLTTIAHEKRHVTLGGAMKVETSSLKTGVSYSAAQNASYRAEEILTTAEEIAFSRLALGSDYEVSVEHQEKLYRLRNMIRNWVTEDEFKRLRSLIIQKLRQRFTSTNNCDTSLTLGVLTSMEHNKWFYCDGSTGTITTPIPEGLNICTDEKHTFCHKKP